MRALLVCCNVPVAQPASHVTTIANKIFIAFAMGCVVNYT